MVKKRGRKPKKDGEETEVISFRVPSSIFKRLVQYGEKNPDTMDQPKTPHQVAKDLLGRAIKEFLG